MVFLARLPVSHAATVGAWPSTGVQSSETTVKESLNDSSGFRIGENSKFVPTVAGAQYPGRSPSGTKTAPKRRTGTAAVVASAVRAGTIESRNGNAIVAPMPRRTVRRDNDCFVMNIANLPEASHFAVLHSASVQNPRRQHAD